MHVDRNTSHCPFREKIFLMWLASAHEKVKKKKIHTTRNTRINKIKNSLKTEIIHPKKSCMIQKCEIHTIHYKINLPINE